MQIRKIAQYLPPLIIFLIVILIFMLGGWRELLSGDISFLMLGSGILLFLLSVSLISVATIREWRQVFFIAYFAMLLSLTVYGIGFSGVAFF